MFSVFFSIPLFFFLEKKQQLWLQDDKVYMKHFWLSKYLEGKLLREENLLITTLRKKHYYTILNANTFFNNTLLLEK